MYSNDRNHESRFTFEDAQRLISQIKIILVEIASVVGLGWLLYEGLAREMKW